MTHMASLNDVVNWIPGAKLLGQGSALFNRVVTDTRTLVPGDLFVALKGDRFDANDMLADAHSRGAVAAICHAGASPALSIAHLPRIEVEDSKSALGTFAATWRHRFTLPVVAVTGSNGKTTVTQMIASIFRAWKPQAMLATQGNLNNDIGVPLTLLRLGAGHEVAVVELGMNHPGEIAYLAAMTQPTVALVNNAQREHLEFMSTVEAVALENGSVIGLLTDAGTAVFPADDTFCSLWRNLAGKRPSWTFAVEPFNSTPASPEVSCKPPVWQDGAWRVQASTPAGPLDYSLAVAGLHNVKNSLAAVTCALAVGVPLRAIGQGLESFMPVKGRSRALSLQLNEHACTVVDDTYNANPDSVRAAIDVLAGLPGPHLLVLGDMGEVGEQGPQFHAEVGDYARERGIETLFTLGSLATSASQHFGAGKHFDNVDSLNAAVVAEWPRYASALVKGSRFMKMERVIEAMVASAQPNKENLHVV
jgi:UDP-N-acetylmuramoyl-tripeptide--D-alanyl-D-alanine ligase